MLVTQLILAFILSILFFAMLLSDCWAMKICRREQAHLIGIPNCGVTKPGRATAIVEGRLMRLFLVTGTVLAVLAGPAFASECPSLIQKAEEAMKMAKLDDAKMKKIMDHIAQAKSEHEAGKHDDAVVTAKDALQLTGM